MNKSAEAFRTISEVADELDVPKHVLRFWELKFPQIRPMKRGGGRRYYRPQDVELLRGIRHLLHTESYTIRGVQKIFREQGVDHIKDLARAAAQEGRERKRKTGAGGSSPARDADRLDELSVSPARISEALAIRVAIAELRECRAILLGEQKEIREKSSRTRARP